MPTDPRDPDVQAQASGVYTTVCAFLTKHSCPAFIARPVAGVAAAVVLVGTLLEGVLIGGIVVLVVPFATAILKIIDDVRTQGAPEFAKVSATALSELLGTPVSTDQLSPNVGPAGNLQRSRTLGNQLLDVLENEFTGNRGITNEGGKTAAAAFLGYNVNFGSTNAFVGLLGELLSFGQFKEFRELGVEVARNLGLGRLSRQALGPLIRNTIEQPYDKYLRSKYRQDDLTEAQLVHALWRGAKSQAEVQQALAEKGYTDKDIAQLIVELTPNLNLGQVRYLLDFGAIDEQTAENALVANGMPRVTAQQMLLAEAQTRAISWVNEYLAIARAKLVTGLLDPTMTKDLSDTEANSIDQFRAILDPLPLSDLEKKRVMDLVGLYFEFPRAKPTMAQLQEMLDQGIVDFDYVDRWFNSEGYSNEDVINLELLMLLKLSAFADKEAKAAELKAKKAVAKPANKTPKTLTPTP